MNTENKISALLRLLLVILTFFIAWSILALISSIYQPFSGASLIRAQNAEPSSLALSLVEEIFSSYFSLFSVITIALILLSLCLAFQLAKGSLLRLFTLTAQQKPSDVLLSRIFSNRPKKELELRSEDEIRTFQDSGEIVLGPSTVVLKPYFTGVIEDRSGSQRLAIYEGIHPICVNKNEKMVRLYDLNPQKLGLEVKMDPKSGSEIGISLNLEVITKNALNGDHQPLIKSLYSFSYPDFWHSIKEIIQLEFAILHHEFLAEKFALQATEERKGLSLQPARQARPRSTYIPTSNKSIPFLVRSKKKRMAQIGPRFSNAGRKDGSKPELKGLAEGMVGQLSKRVNATLEKLTGEKMVKFTINTIGGKE